MRRKAVCEATGMVTSAKLQATQLSKFGRGCQSRGCHAAIAELAMGAGERAAPVASACVDGGRRKPKPLGPRANAGTCSSQVLCALAVAPRRRRIGRDVHPD